MRQVFSSGAGGSQKRAKRKLTWPQVWSQFLWNILQKDVCIFNVMHALLLLLHTASMLPMLAVCVSAVYSDVLTILILLSTPGWFHLEQPVGTERASDASRHPELVGAGEGQAAGSGLHPPAPGLWPQLSDNHAKRWERHVCGFMHIAKP